MVMRREQGRSKDRPERQETSPASIGTQSQVNTAKVSRTGDAIAIAPGAVAISGVGTVTLTTAPAAVSYYRDQIGQIAPNRLLDRAVELAELAAFCTASDADAPAYRWWQAPKWSGKSALMATFALEPPPGVRVVAFFVTARWAGHDTREAFVDIVGDQLAEILGEPSPTTMPPHVRDSYLTGLLTRAARACQSRKERLVLLVDGLDEDRTTPHDRPGLGTSIAAALPACPPTGIRILVGGRPNPRLPADVPDDHPLRDTAVLRALDASPHAKVAEDRMLLELDRMLHAGPEERDLLGLLTAARGGLTAADLAELTDQIPRRVHGRLRKVAARTFDTRNAHWRPENTVYLLGHEDLQAVAAEELGEHQLAAYGQRLHEWAERYRALAWPPRTPEYLLRGYHRMLAATNDLPRMAALGTDTARHNRMLDLSGGDNTALTEITTAQDHLLLHNPVDLLSMLRLAIHRDHLTSRNDAIPPSLPACWARRGYTNRALALANSIADPVNHVAAMGRLVVAVAETGTPEQAHSLLDRTEAAARNIIDPFMRAWSLLHVVAATATMGDLERAEATARGITDPRFQVQSLAYLAEAVTRTGDIERARALIADAETTVSRRFDSGPRSIELMGIAEALVGIGELERAEAIARSLGTYEESSVLTQLVEAIARAGDGERAEATARTITDPGGRAGALARLAATLARCGSADHGDRARSLVNDAEAIGQEITEPSVRAHVLADLAAVVARIGVVDRSHSLIDDVQAALQTVSEPHHTRILTAMVTATAACGDLLRAENIARSIADPRGRTMALEQVAIPLARAGDMDRAEALAREFIDVPFRPHPRTHVAKAIADAGDLVRAEAVARGATDARRWVWALGDIAAALTQTGELDRAEALVRDEIDPSWRSLPLERIAAARAHNGELDRAEALARDITASDSRASVLGEIAAASAYTDDPERASRVLDEAEGAARNVGDFEYQAKLFLHLAAVAVEIDDEDRARALVDHVLSIVPDIADRDGRALTQAWLVDVFTQVGDLERAEAIACDIDNPDSYLWVLADIVDAFMNAGEARRARTLIDRADGLLRSYTEPDEQAWALVQLAGAFVQADDLERARSLIDEAENIAHVIVKPEARDWALKWVAGAAVWVGDLERAGTIADGLTAPGHRDEALTDVATACAEDGDREHAEAIANGISDPDRRATAMLNLARLLPPDYDGATEADDGRRLTSPSLECGGPDRRWLLIGASLRLTKWEKSIEILTELIPATTTVALHELDVLGWRPVRGHSRQRGELS
jgi:tetratricopeptide (TPR) repeat protein